VGLICPYIQYLGSYYFVPFAVILLLAVPFLIVWLPETKGTTPEELRDDIVQSLSTMIALSTDETNANHSISVGNLIDVRWRQVIDDLKRAE